MFFQKSREVWVVSERDARRPSEAHTATEMVDSPARPPTSPTTHELPRNESDALWACNHLKQAVGAAAARGVADAVVAARIAAFIIEVDMLMPPPEEMPVAAP